MLEPKVKSVKGAVAEIIDERSLPRGFVPSAWTDVLAYQLDHRYLEFYCFLARTEYDVK